MSDPALCSAVILTMGDRPAALATAVASLRRQRDCEIDVVIVWNGESVGQPGLADIDVELATNVGIPAGRNAGAYAASGSTLLFLDDDAEIVDDDAVSRALDRLADDDDRFAVVGFRIVDEEDETASRHVPRPGGRGADRSGEVAAFLGGACVIRRDAFETAGGLAGEFFYAMEETDLSLALADDGWRLWYAAELRVRHPRTVPARHPDAIRRTARNRVWLAHRRLPLAIGVVYIVLWTAITLGRAPRQFGQHLRGLREGWRDRPGPRRPIAWRTAWRLTRIGRPPLI